MGDNNNYYFAGIEGGATCSKFALMKMDGEILTWTEGPGTNYFVRILLYLLYSVIINQNMTVHIFQ